MPVPLPRREEIIRTFRDSDGRPIEVREWVRENIYKPLDGYKTWPRIDGGQLCEECAPRVGEIRAKRRLCSVKPHGKCVGLRGFKILVVVVDVTRQEGKTTGGATYELTELVEGRNSSCMYLAASENQSDRVFDQKFMSMLNSRPDLKAQLVTGMDSIENTKRNNKFLYVPTSVKSIAAGSFRLLFIDEVRDVEDEVIYKAIPIVTAIRGIECPHGHATDAMPKCPECGEALEGFECDVHGDFPAPPCPACGVEMEEYMGRVLMCSSAGEDSALFTELVERLRERPDPNFHLYSSSARLNAAKSRESVGAFKRVFGDLTGGAALVAREFDNVPGRAGDEYLSKDMIDAIVDERLRPVEAFEGPCVGFLDCSRTTDLSSLVILADLTKSETPWTSTAAIRIDEFDPADRRRFPSGRVRYKPVPGDPKAFNLQDHLAWVVPRFPGLLELWIDTTLIEDARDLYLWAKKQPFRSKIFEYPPEREKEQVKKLIWDSLEARVLAGPRAIRIPKLARLIKELRSAKTKVTENGIQKVMDSGAGDRRGKRRMHRDISMSLAACCWLANKRMARALAPSTGGVVDRLNASMAQNRAFKTPSSDILGGRW